MITYAGIKTALWGSKFATVVSLIGLAFFIGWGYGQLKYWQGGVEAEVVIVKNSNKKAKKKHNIVRNKKSVIRARPSSANRDRLREKYSRSDRD